jgi:hypothetical protein
MTWYEWTISGLFMVATMVKRWCDIGQFVSMSPAIGHHVHHHDGHHCSRWLRHGGTPVDNMVGMADEMVGGVWATCRN